MIRKIRHVKSYSATIKAERSTLLQPQMEYHSNSDNGMFYQATLCLIQPLDILCVTVLFTCVPFTCALLLLLPLLVCLLLFVHEVCIFPNDLQHLEQPELDIHNNYLYNNNDFPTNQQC